MSWMRSSGPFVILSLVGFISMIIAVFGIIYDNGWTTPALATLIIIVFLVVLLIVFGQRKREEALSPIEEFEKSLKGGLYHFKCPTCMGIFAVKKSRSNNKKTVKMNCPDCGAVGYIPSYPAEIEEEIPEKKSIKANFKCTLCGEGVTIWAEGTELFSDVNVYSCPFCGGKEPLERL